ncbi:C2 domain-containing protein [Purpureocillium lavendulum]|uniref:C2 domain-containing protein n=1 Tax=Purpureocillium lavendulum TaxID=1247861 RepID=A0AB34G806_9HYPO|nr:C2 domain-containing protein [Purpureocillium lavendulum]
MAIRDRVRRALHKSDSSDSVSQADSNSTTVTTTTATSDTSSLHKTTTTTSTLSKVLSFGSRDRTSDRNKSKDKEAKKSRGRRSKPVHPSQRPLTLQNLKHQEMLSHFTMTFGASDPSQIERLSFCGVSPCCTRPGSVDLDRGDFNLSSHTSALSIADTPSSDSARQ